jgi:hypothetical protein
MPQSPIILPIIITGLTLGSVLASQTKTISKKKLAGVSLITGLLNSAYAYLFYQLNPPPTFSRGTYTGTYAGAAGAASARFQAGGGTSIINFIISSFFTGFIFVIAVCGIAILYARFRGKKEHEEDEEVEDEKTVDNEDEMKKLEKLEDT